MRIVIMARVWSSRVVVIAVIEGVENIFTVLFVGKGERNGLGGILQHELVETGNGEVVVRTLSVAGGKNR